MPGGAHTYSRGSDQFPENAPELISHGEGAYFWDSKGNRYLDFGMGLRSVTLGHAYPAVTEAVSSELRKGNGFSRPSQTEYEAAVRFVDVAAGLDMVKFAKNGSNVTTAAVKLARSQTGRNYVLVPRQQPFFSFDDWFIGTTAMRRGCLSEASRYTRLFEFGDLESVRSLFEELRDQVACVLMEPFTPDSFCNDCQVAASLDDVKKCTRCAASFIHGVREICRDNDALLVIDEMITGFRAGFPGVYSHLDLEPDLVTFGKAMSNGFSVAALGGRRDVMSLGGIDPMGAERTFLLSSTNGAESTGLRAFLATVAEYESESVVDHLWKFGHKLRSGLEELAVREGLKGKFRTAGIPPLLSYYFDLGDGNANVALRTIFNHALLDRGVFFSWIAPSLSHGQRELDQLFDACEFAFHECSRALSSGIDDVLRGSPIQPVFRRYN